MEEVKNNSGQALGTAALITGIVSLIIAVIPCIGIIAIVPGIVTIVLAAVALSQATSGNSPRGTIIAGLIIGIVALLISSSQIAVGKKITSRSDKFPKEIREIIRDVKSDLQKELEDAKVNIKIQNNGETIEIDASGSEDKEVLIKQLEELEKGKEEKKDSLPSR